MLAALLLLQERDQRPPYIFAFAASFAAEIGSRVIWQ
jgi:hypothetical protein